MLPHGLLPFALLCRWQFRIADDPFTNPGTKFSPGHPK